MNNKNLTSNIEPAIGPNPGPDWWRNKRFGPISGRYEGEMTAPTVGLYILDLRVDIDPCSPNSPVMERISGDIYQVFRSTQLGSAPLVWNIYRESWIVDSPTVTWSQCQVEILGTVRFWNGVHPATTIRVRIPWSTFMPTGPAEVSFTESGANTSSYNCAKKSDCFRELTLEVDVCQSVNKNPILPSYDTHAHATPPVNLPQRTLTIEEAYREAGIFISIQSEHTIVDDSAPEFSRWSPAELHDAMETHFSQYRGEWPKWHLWGLLAGTFDDSPGWETGGIMFDAGVNYGGAGESPDRQGFAVFRNHRWFKNLVAGTPTNRDEAEAMRQFLHTWVHEAGHAFNLLHSWDKGRPKALSWMNYPDNVDHFWDKFRFRFDDEELIHIRHGNRASVIMGGDPWASGGHQEASSGAFNQLVGDAPIEFLLRSKGYFDFMEPVIIEFRLRNLLKDLPLHLDTRLNPEHGGVRIFIRRPDGRIVEYAPILCKLSTPYKQTLQPKRDAAPGPDRYSENVFLSYGSSGFNFDMPGDYFVRALYQGSGDMLIPSNVHRVRIGHPFSRDEERIAQDFFSYEVGMSLYLNGSSSAFLKKGMDTLETIADHYKETPTGAHLSLVLAWNLKRPFFRIVEGKLEKVRSAKPEDALALTTRAYEQHKRDKSTFTNISYHQLRRTRADLMIAMGKKNNAQEELGDLVKNLKENGVNQSVIDEIKEYARNI